MTGYEKAAELRYQTITPVKGGQVQRLDSPLGEALAPFLVWNERTLHTVLAQTHVTDRLILSRLLEASKITLDDIEEVGREKT